jgi:hypothetical protein
VLGPFSFVLLKLTAPAGAHNDVGK